MINTDNIRLAYRTLEVQNQTKKPIRFKYLYTNGTTDSFDLLPAATRKVPTKGLVSLPFGESLNYLNPNYQELTIASEVGEVPPTGSVFVEFNGDGVSYEGNAVTYP